MNRQLTAEFIGTALLVAIVIGSGIAGDRLSGSSGLALLINAFATGACLIALILAFGPASGGHFNPAVTLGEGLLGTMPWIEVAGYSAAQVSGGFIGTMVAEAMFGDSLLALSSTDRLEGRLLLAEAVATAGLLMVIIGCVRGKRPASTVAFAVGGYIASAYFFTASTSFANPAVTIARVFTDTFAGIAPSAAIAFVPVQLFSAGAAVIFMRWLYPSLTSENTQLVIPDRSEDAAP